MVDHNTLQSCLLRLRERQVPMAYGWDCSDARGQPNWSYPILNHIAKSSNKSSKGLREEMEKLAEASRQARDKEHRD